MNKKLIIQLSLFSAIIIFFLIVFFIYFDNNNKNIENSKTKVDLSPEKIKTDDDANIIKNLEYSSTDERGNSYVIKSEYGTIKKEKFFENNISYEKDIIYMTNVTATIQLENSNLIDIYSDYARYDNVSYETNFSKNVFLSYLDHRINCNNIDLSFNDNLVSIYNNVIYKKLFTRLEADKIEIDLITKNSKIFMYDPKKKIKIKIKNL